MKKLIIITIIIFSLIIPELSYAKEKNFKIQIVSQKTVVNKCKHTKNHSPDLFGCYWFSRNNETIYITDNLKNDDFDFIFYHEYAHYMMWGKGKTLWNRDEELKADEFAYWGLSWYEISPEKEAFFKEIMKKYAIQISKDYKETKILINQIQNIKQL